MPQQTLYLILGIGLWILIGYLFAKITFKGLLQEARAKSVKQSRSVLLGDVNEKIAPALPGFPYHFKDMVFIGKGIDYLVFDGLAERNLRQIILLEIKSWTSSLNQNEKMIRGVISKWKVCYEVFRTHL